MSVRLARLLSVALIGACFAVPVSAKGPAASKASTKAPALIWRGDVATANGVVNDVAKAWEKAGHGRIELQPFNTASGIDAVATGTADLAGSARPADNSAQNAGLTFTPVAWDGLVIITQSSNPISGLTLKQVHDIYYGKVHDWSEVGGRTAPIDVYAVASPGDGVEYSLRSLLFGRGNQPVAAPRLYVNTRKLEEGIALNPNGFGVAMLSGISGNAKLKAIPINGKSATVANIADGSYPLFIPLYLVTNPSSPKAADTQAFIDFVQSDEGKAVLRKHAVLPYQDGNTLAAMDASRRSTILAEVGARSVPAAAAPASTPVSAPGATYAARAAVAPTSELTLAAKKALEERRAETTAATAAKVEVAQLEQVSGSVVDVSVTSVARADGSATTVSQEHGADFAKVTADASQAASTYKVVKGDTLSSIARRHGVKVAELREWNQLKGDQLKLGQLVRVSAL